MVGMCTKVVWLSDLKEDWRSQPVNREGREKSRTLSVKNYFLFPSPPPEWFVDSATAGRKKRERKRKRGCFCSGSHPFLPSRRKLSFFFLESKHCVAFPESSGQENTRNIFGTLKTRERGIYFFPAPIPDWFGANIGRNSGRAFLPFPKSSPFSRLSEGGGRINSRPLAFPSPYRNTSCMAHTSVAILRKCPTISFPNRKH